MKILIGILSAIIIILGVILVVEVSREPQKQFQYGDEQIQDVIDAFKEKYSDVGITEFPDSKGVPYKYSSESGVDLILEKDRVVLRAWEDKNTTCIVTNPFPRDVWDNCPLKW